MMIELPKREAIGRTRNKRKDYRNCCADNPHYAAVVDVWIYKE
jgi:hypothetical protein